jgi:DNA-binding MarR family transcriptional regulator
LRESVGISLNWYDVLVHIEDVPEGLGMTALAGRILASKSGLTRVVDRMEEAGLVRRLRLPGDRRGVQVAITQDGLDLLARARPVHHAGIRRHFLDHVDAKDIPGLSRALGGVCDHMRTLRPGRVGSGSAPSRAKKRAG